MFEQKQVEILVFHILVLFELDLSYLSGFCLIGKAFQIWTKYLSNWILEKLIVIFLFYPSGDFNLKFNLIMALVSGGRSTLNPNAPLFVPAAMRQVEDFSPEWWNLVTTSTSFRDYWVSQNQGDDIFGEEENGFDDNNVVGLLPENIDLDVDEDILNMEAQFEEFLQSTEADYGNKAFRGVMENGIP